ncbi:MAG: FadR family transcriptional regulator [Clostridia bacterium]|nr:FadR family transcriptional regulator [Clostridia bacterium]
MEDANGTGGGKQRQVAQHVIREVQRRVLSGELRPGHRLPSERTWSLELGVTRQNVREALRVLEVLGLVERRPRGGTYVADMEFPQAFLPVLMRLRSGERFLPDIMELRRILEPGVCALAAERADPDDLAEIRRAHEELARRALEDGWDAAQDSAFHLAVARATHNRAVTALMATLEELFASWRHATQKGAPPFDLRGSREAIVRAIERHDRRSAWAAMVMHLDEVARYTRLERDERRGAAQALAETLAPRPRPAAGARRGRPAALRREAPGARASSPAAPAAPAPATPPPLASPE